MDLNVASTYRKCRTGIRVDGLCAMEIGATPQLTIKRLRGTSLKRLDQPTDVRLHLNLVERYGINLVRDVSNRQQVVTDTQILLE